ncbi:MAG: DNA methyltransferase [Candidatus Nitrosopolaris sp.]
MFITQKTIDYLKGSVNRLDLDPIMGIGTTALACIHLGVNYIGTEMNPQYIKIAHEQISGNIEKYLQCDEAELI